MSSLTQLLRITALLFTIQRQLSSASHLPAHFDVPMTGDYSRNGQLTGDFRIATWNIDRGYRFDNIVAALQHNGPDICLLQEVDLHDRRTGNRDVAREIASELGENYSFGIEFQELSQSISAKAAYHGQATLSRFPIVASRVLRFERQSGFWKPNARIPNLPLFQRRLGGRIALVTELSIGGRRVVVYNLHLESRSGGRIQDAQLQEVFQDLKRYPPGTPAIIGGDLNSKYHPASVLRTLEREGFQSVLGDRLQRTHVIIGVLDWIFIRGQFKIVSASVVRGTHGSDHDMVQAVLRPNSESMPPRASQTKP